MRRPLKKRNIQLLVTADGLCAALANAMSVLFYGRFNKDLKKFTHYLTGAKDDIEVITKSRDWISDNLY